MRKRSLSNKLNFICLFTFLSATFFSCKENTILPPDLVPAVDNINVFDKNLNVISHSEYRDSLISGGKSGSINFAANDSYLSPLGTISTDLVFGKTVASAYVQVVQPVLDYKLKGTNQIIDSVVLVVPFGLNVYGDTISNNIQTFNLYQSDSNYSLSKLYYEFSKANYQTSNLMGTATVNFKTLNKDSITVGTAKQAPQLRFKMPAKFADSLLAIQSTDNYKTFDNFINWSKGFVIMPSDTTTGNGIGYFKTYFTKMYVYYRNTNSNSLQDTTIDIFGFNENYCNRFNSITRNYFGLPIQNFWETASTTGDSVTFIQGQPGASTVITFPGIENEENVLVNQAVLTLNVVVPYTSYTDTNSFKLPEALKLEYVNSAGENKIAKDYSFLGAIVDGKRRMVDINGQTVIQYRFVITKTIQDAISQKDKNLKIKVLAEIGNTAAKYRTVLAGSNNSNNLLKPKLYLIFTKLK
ncbi:MAG: DUF4270 family protein [Chitinophagaceae bacterium]|nr:DUF4270 family protein [Chitinophagaceae bacterium]